MPIHAQKVNKSIAKTLVPQKINIKCSLAKIYWNITYIYTMTHLMQMVNIIQSIP